MREISKYYCGDWESFSEIMRKDNIKFDYIFASETIYNVENYSKLHTVFEICLKNDGFVYPLFDVIIFNVYLM